MDRKSLLYRLHHLHGLLANLLCTHFRSDDYKNLYHLVTHQERRDTSDVTTKFIFAGVLLSCLKAIGYFEGVERPEEGKPSEEEILIGSVDL